MSKKSKSPELRSENPDVAPADQPVAAIFAATGAIAGAVARELARRGTRVFVSARNGAAAEQLAANLRAAGASGAVGTALVQLARAAGADVVGTASRAKLELVERSGGAPIDYTRADLEAALRTHAPSGYDAVFDAAGVASFRRSFRLTRTSRGRLVTFAVQDAARHIQRRSPVAMLRFGLAFGMMQVLLRWWSLAGGGRRASFYGVVDHRRDHPDWYRADLGALSALRRAGRIAPIVERMGLDEAVEAHTRLDRGEVRGQLLLVT